MVDAMNLINSLPTAQASRWPGGWANSTQTEADRFLLSKGGAHAQPFAMKPNGGGKEPSSSGEHLFPNTQWTLVLRARDGATAALNTLCLKYRRPLLIWLQGRQREFHGLEPEDLVNGFLASKLQQKILKAASADKGKFRSFVRACLNNYIKDELSKHNAQMRGGRIPHQSVDESDEDGRPLVEPVSADASADKEYDRAWGLAILASAIGRLEDELCRKGHLALWKRLEPLLYEAAEA